MLTSFDFQSAGEYLNLQAFALSLFQNHARSVSFRISCVAILAFQRRSAFVSVASAFVDLPSSLHPPISA